jgi:endonuclease G
MIGDPLHRIPEPVGSRANPTDEDGAGEFRERAIRAIDKLNTAPDNSIGEGQPSGDLSTHGTGYDGLPERPSDLMPVHLQTAPSYIAAAGIFIVAPGRIGRYTGYVDPKWCLRMIRPTLVAATLLLIARVAPAAPTACSEQFLGGQAPDLINQQLAAKTRELCFSEFAVLHSGVTRTPLWSAEHLTVDQVKRARKMERTNTFHAEDRLPADERAELGDYKRSGYDRGHMAPSGDMPDEESQQASFSLANMVPQNGDSNRGVWSGIESSVRDLAEHDGDLYVVTGPVYKGESLKRIGGRVLVPTYIYKAVYDSRQRQAGAYLVANAPGKQWETLSITQLQELTGIDAFPALAASIKAAAMPLPPPKQHGRRSRKAEPEAPAAGFAAELLDKLKSLAR